MGVFKCSTLMTKINEFESVFFYLFFLQYLINFLGIQSCKVRVRLKLGFFSNSKVLEMCPEGNPKVRVRLKLGCGLN